MPFISFIHYLFTFNNRLYLSLQYKYFFTKCFITLKVLSSIPRQTRSSILDVLVKDYIRTARVKGVKERDVMNKQALRNGILPSSYLIIGEWQRHLQDRCL
ncbi:MAG: hypothetical protein ACFFFT_01710 [Candidatus Thorarchaeota archaeon]